MGLFGFGKKEVKKEDKKVHTCGCCGGCGSSGEVAADAKEASVKVLGSGCMKCNQLEEATIEALAELGMDTTVDHVTDFSEIAKYGVMSTPALVVNGKVISYGKVLKKDEVKALLQK